MSDVRKRAIDNTACMVCCPDGAHYLKDGRDLGTELRGEPGTAQPLSDGILPLMQQPGRHQGRALDQHLGFLALDAFGHCIHIQSVQLDVP